MYDHPLMFENRENFKRLCMSISKQKMSFFKERDNVFNLTLFNGFITCIQIQK